MESGVPLERIKVLNPPRDSETILNIQEMPARLLNRNYTSETHRDDQFCEPIRYENKKVE